MTIFDNFEADAGEQEWNTIKYFQTEWLTQINEHQKDLFYNATLKQHMSWFEYLPNTENPRDSRYRCRLCSTYFKTLGISKGQHSPFSTEVGILKKHAKANSNAMNQHAKTTSHLLIIDKLKEIHFYGEPQNQF